MFNPKVIVLISGLIAVVNAQSAPAELTGSKREEAVKQLQFTLNKLASNPKNPKYKYNVKDVGKITPSIYGDTQVKYELKLQKDYNAPKNCTLYLTVAETFDDVIIMCPAVPDFNDTIYYLHAISGGK